MLFPFIFVLFLTGTALFASPPIANDKTYQVDSNGTLIGNIITDTPADSDPEGAPISLNDHNSTLFTIGSDGSFTYSPTSAFCGYTFDYNITDGTEVSNVATITIDAKNTPIAVDDYFITGIDRSLTENVLKNDGNTSYTVSFSQPSNGTLTDKGNGSFLYTPDSVYTGLDTFDYNVTDGTCSTIVTATVEIQVTDVCGGTELILNPCGSADINVSKNLAVAWFFRLQSEAIVDVNITNTGSSELLYDLKKTDCPDLFSSNTTSELAQGKKIDVVQKYPAGVYYFGFAGAHNDIDLNLSICYDENLSSGGGNSSFFANVGINEVGNSYNSFPEIRTKLVNKNFGLRASFLDGTTSTIVYDGGTDEAKLPITLSFIDDIGTVIVPGIIYLEIDHNTSFVEMKFDGSHYLAGDGGLSGNILSSPNVVAYAAKIRKYKIASLNFGAVSGNHAGLNCQWSSLSSSMCGLPACFNSEDVIKEVFPPAFFPDVLTCLYGDGGVGASPCDQNAYIGNCAGNKKTITPEKYNNYLGCFQCLHDAGGPPIYSDPFAIRPRAFDVNVPTTIFRAGKPTGLEFKALDGRDGSISTLPSPPVLPSDEYSDEYNETEDRLQDGTMFTIDLNVSAPTNCEIKELTLIPYVHFHDGYDDGNYTPNSAGLIFNEIGDINMSIHETNGTEFAKVDADDTPLNDTLIGGVLIDGRLIHEYNANFTVIPDHFEVITTLSNHNTVNNFTYISADLNMSSILDINITAQGEDNLTTVNYTENCYAYPIDLDIGLSYSDSNNTLDNLLYLIEDDNNTYKPPLITVLKSNNNISILNIIKGIFSDKLDHNGTAVLAMNLNFDRRVNEAANPFDMDVTDINATDDEHSPENVKGTNAPDSNATYFYGRAKPNQEFYDNVTTTSIKTPVSIIAYCDLGLIACQNRKLTSLVNGFVKDAQSEANWWFSEVHSTDPGKDGLVTLTTANGTVSPIDPSSIILTNGIDNEVLVTNSGGTTPYIVDINFGPNTDTWLIYNKDANSTPSPFYRVRFIGGAGTGKWSTTGNLPGVGHVVGDDINTKKVKRLEW